MEYNQSQAVISAVTNGLDNEVRIPYLYVVKYLVY
jgi:hypothetical protein